MKYRIPYTDQHVEIQFPADRAARLERLRLEADQLAELLLTVEATVEFLFKNTELPLWACQPQIENFNRYRWVYGRDRVVSGWTAGRSYVTLEVNPYRPVNADPTHVYYEWHHDPSNHASNRDYHLILAARATGEMVAHHRGEAAKWPVDSGKGSCPRDAISLPPNLLAALAYIRPTEGGGNLARTADFLSKHRLTSSGGSLQPPTGLLKPL
jgi:hypothetical protein